MDCLQLPRIYMEQTAQYIIMLEQMEKNKEIEQPIKDVIEMYQLQLGIDNDPIQNPQKRIIHRWHIVKTTKSFKYMKMAWA